MLRDVSEDAASKHQLHVVERPEVVRVAGVASKERDARETDLVDPTSPLLDQPFVELNQERADVVAPGVMLENPEEIAAVAGAETDDADLPFRCDVEAVSDQAPDGDQATAERRTGVVVGVVPLDPVGSSGRACVLILDWRMLARTGPPVRAQTASYPFGGPSWGPMIGPNLAA